MNEIPDWAIAIKYGLNVFNGFLACRLSYQGLYYKHLRRRERALCFGLVIALIWSILI